MVTRRWKTAAVAGTPAGADVAFHQPVPTMARRAFLVAIAGWLLGATPELGAQRRTADPSAVPMAVLAAPTTDELRAHVAFLADDLLGGRAPGTIGGDVAARYIATRFEAAGLRPAGPGGSYFSWVQMVGVRPEPSLVIGAQRRTLVLQPGGDFVAWPERPESVTTVDGDLVFVGYGIEAREWSWDDYKATPLNGKIVMVQLNDPGLRDSSVFGGRRLTRYALPSYKLEQAARAGATGVLLIHASHTTAEAWSVVRNAWAGEQLQLDRPPTQTLRFAGWISSDAARRVVEATGKDYDLLLRRADARDFRPVEVGAHAAVDIRSTLRRLRSPNVAAVIGGSDPEARRETVILTAHYDALGIGSPVSGDSVYNGAVDNASGVAMLIAAAAALAKADVPPRRSIMFLATTAHEAGLRGTAAYLTAPLVALPQTVAVVNVDQANLWGVARDVVGLGADLSTLGETLNAAARAETLTVRTDLDPVAGSFFRSDQWLFAQAGVPALAVQSGTGFVGRPPGWGADQMREYRSDRYHQPTDEVRPDFDYAGLLQEARLLIRLGWMLAQDMSFPEWAPSSEFRAAGQRLRQLR